MMKIMDWVDRFAGNEFESQRKMVREAMNNPDHPYYSFIRKIINDVDPHVMQTLASNFFINAGIDGWKKQEACRKKYQCNIPWTILLDPTSACNLHCTGCWAAEYGNKLMILSIKVKSLVFICIFILVVNPWLKRKISFNYVKNMMIVSSYVLLMQL